MITVEMSDDIRKFENKTVGPFTSRQVKSMLIGLLYTVPIVMMIPISLSNKFFVALFLFAPAFACGYVRLDGAYFEQIVLNLLYMYILTPRKRKQIQKSEFMSEYRAYKEKEEKIKLSKMDAAQKKKYLETHGKDRKVIYSNRKEFKVYR
nr:PrgI family protein [uncultured Butyrivibrio sp.]